MKQSMTEKEYQYLTFSGSPGICMQCGAVTESGVEPDIGAPEPDRCYRCEACGARAVWGLEQALIGGRLVLTETVEARR